MSVAQARLWYMRDRFLEKIAFLEALPYNRLADVSCVILL